MGFFDFFSQSSGLEAGLETFRNTPGSVLLDVRTPEEYAAGHVPGAVNLPLDRITEIDSEQNAPLFVYCASGARSAQATSWLNSQGYRAENLGGVMGYRGTLKQGAEA